MLRSRQRVQDIAGGWLRLATISSIAVAQPVFDTLARSPSFFVNHGARPAEIYLFAVLVLLGPPLVLAAFETTALPFGRSAHRYVHLANICLLGSLLFAPLLDRIGVLGDPLVVAGSLAGGVAVAVSCARVAAVRRILTVGAVIPVAVCVWFLFASPVSAVRKDTDAEAIGKSLKLTKTPPIVVLSFDELPLTSLLTPDGKLDAERYPNLAALAQKATWYRNATTVSDVTGQALPAILTGRFVRPATAWTSTALPKNLFTLLGGVYAFNAPRPFGGAEERPHTMCPLSACPDPLRSAAPQNRFAIRRTLAQTRGMLLEGMIIYGYIASPSGLERNLPPAENLGLGLSRPYIAGSDVTVPPRPTPDWRWDKYTAWLNEIERSENPRAYVMHMFLPHRPWTMLPSSVRHSRADVRILGLDSDFVWSSDRSAVLSSHHRHLLQVGAVDSLVGHLMRRLDDAGIFDDALVIVTSDHGIAFQPSANVRVDMDRSTRAEIAAVPLLIRLPGQNVGRISDVNAQLTDILPTIIDVLGIDPGWTFDGTSLRSGDRAREKTLVDARGRTLTLPADFLPEVLAAARRNLDDLGLPNRPHNEIERYYSIGHRSELIGTSTARFAFGTPIDLAWKDRDETVSRQPTGTAVLVSASTAHRSVAGREIAVVVNGRIAAVRRAFTWTGRVWVDAVIPPPLLARGPNSIELYLLEETPRGVILQPTGYARPPR